MSVVSLHAASSSTAERLAGIAIAQQNTVYGDWSLDADQIVFGTVGDDKTFVAKRDYASSAADINAVRVEAGHSYNSIVAGVAFGATELGAHAISTVVVPAATGSASKVECWLPLVLPDCHFSEGPPREQPGRRPTGRSRAASR